jgi:Uma2 family endonuclease
MSIVMPAVKEKLLTAKELFAMGDIGPCELVEGVIVKMTPTVMKHGIIVTRVSKVLDIFVQEHKLGQVGAGDVGFITKRDPDTVRAADVLFIAAGRLAGVEGEGFLPIAPDLAVEVVSPGDRWSEVLTKVNEYLAAGVRLVWVVDPRTETVHVYRLGRVEQLSADDTLDGGDVLPGFALLVSEIFAD